jgi:hypothetical protein
MTEEEAKTKWCPFARVIENGSASGAHNRVQLPQGTDTRAPVASFCIASACMAWRLTAPIALRRIDSPGTVGVATGYCGLAGAPQ